MSPSDEVKNRLDIVEVIREYIALKPAGRNFQALCPFHNEKTPSLVISPDKQIWHCFGCGKGGDVFTFVMEKEGLSFGEALRLLAVRAGVRLPAFNQGAANQRNRLLDIVEQAVAYYAQVLRSSPTAEEARGYLAERGLNEEMIDEWQIGYSPESWDDLLNFLKNKGFNERDILVAGLAAQKNGSNRIFNRFRGRIMFPIHDVNANFVGFTARVLPSRDGRDGLGKYINSPQSQIFDKSKILFGLPFAKNAIREQGYVVIVEGQMDVITAHQFGFKNVVASSGTALTGEQIHLLERFTDNFLFALDADQAGQSATDRAGEALTAADMKIVEAPDRFGQLRRYIDSSKSFKKNIKVAIMPSGKDPDDCIRHDRAGWIRALAEAKPLMQYYFDKILSKLDLDTAEGKRTAAKNLLPLIGRLFNPVEKDFWLKKLSGLIDVEIRLLYEALPVAGSMTAGKQPVATIAATPKSDRTEILSEALLALVCRFPVFIRYFFDQVLPEHLIGQASQLIYKNLILYYNQTRDNQDGGLEVFVFNYPSFKEWLLNHNNQQAVYFLDKLAIMGERDFSSYSQLQADLEIKRIAKFLKKHYLTVRLKELTKLIAELEKSADDQSELDGIMREFNNLTQEMRKLLD